MGVWAPGTSTDRMSSYEILTTSIQTWMTVLIWLMESRSLLVAAPPTQPPLLMYRLHVAQPCSTPSTLLFRPTWLHGSLDPLVSAPFSSHILRLPEETSVRPSSEESIHEGEQILTRAFFSSAGLSPKRPRRKSLLQIHQVPNYYFRREKGLTVSQSR